MTLGDEETQLPLARAGLQEGQPGPLKHADAEAMTIKAAEIRQHYPVEGPLAFLHVFLRDDRSDFESVLRVKVRRWRSDYTSSKSRAPSPWRTRSPTSAS